MDWPIVLAMLSVLILISGGINVIYQYAKLHKEENTLKVVNDEVLFEQKLEPYGYDLPPDKPVWSAEKPLENNELSFGYEILKSSMENGVITIHEARIIAGFPKPEYRLIIKEPDAAENS